MSATLKELRQEWQDVLSTRYDGREVNAMLKIVVQDVLGWSPADVLLKEKDTLSSDNYKQLQEVLERLQQGEPLQYITGSCTFFGLDLKCSPAALIPRPETEELVQWMVESLDKHRVLAMLDCCTGSGCIALALKHRFPNASIAANDVSLDALALARENSRNTGLEVDFQQVDVLDWEIEENERYDLIVSNPPYITREEAKVMRENVLNYEPHLALFVEDEDALLFYRVIAQHALTLLKPQGRLFFELNEYYAEETRLLLTSMGYETTLRQDLQGKARMLCAVRP